jgi:DnaA family protein
VFQIEPLDDAERRAALSQRAKERGLVLSEDVLNYLLTHFNRDMPSLVAILDALDRYGLEKQRALTPSLVREWLASRTSIHPAR